MRVNMGRQSKRAPEEIPLWAHRLRVARENKGLTQDQLGELLAVSPKSLSNWENGVHEPKLADFHAVADATGVEASWIIFGPVGGEPGGTDSSPRVVTDATAYRM